MNRWILLGGIVVLTSMFAAPATVLGDESALDPQSAPAPVPQLWSRVDGPAARGGQDRAWIWGPTLLAETREPYRESPGGSRQVFYFDKGRMEITDPNQDQQAPWYATSGLLVRDMIAGLIQVGDHDFIPAAPADIPIAGDMNGNKLAPTYAALASIASVGAKTNANRDPQRIGQPVTGLLHADGTIDPNGAANAGVVIGSYDDRRGHNVAKVFQDWAAQQAIPPDYLVGIPITEPFWVDTLVGGTQKRVLMQAFERRILTYTPDNPRGWKVEAGNVGLQYRAWRGLKEPDDDSLLPLAREVPYGEVIADVAVRYGLDPYFFAALARVSSGYDPLAKQSDGRAGFFGVRAALLAGQQYPLDPQVNADAAAREIVRLHQQSSDWRAVLASYFTGNDHPDWSNAALNDFVNGVLDAQAQITDDLNTPPAPLTAAASAPALTLVGTGHAAYYSPSYTTAWWDATLQRYAQWGDVAPGWSLDPNGYYCVQPDFTPGQRLQLTANGITIWCTVGDRVARQDEASWRAHWVIELSWTAFKALKLDQNNWVEVRHP